MFVPVRLVGVCVYGGAVCLVVWCGDGMGLAGAALPVRTRGIAQDDSLRDVPFYFSSSPSYYVLTPPQLQRWCRRKSHFECLRVALTFFCWIEDHFGVEQSTFWNLCVSL